MLKRILSGTRPTGPLHIGNYFGAITTWIHYQASQAFFMIADWHVLTTDYASGKSIKDAVFQLSLDLLACGLDTSKCTLFVQSSVPAHAELALILSMITPLSWLERNPTFKDQIRELQGRELNTHGFLGYPVLQAADILLYHAEVVPVGEDQLPHLELTREIARRFNHLYGETFYEPEAVLTAAAKLPGTDGRKMSKSYDNCIYFIDTDLILKEKIKNMMTDPGRKKRNDPGNPKICPVFAYHQVLNLFEASEIEQACSSASIGCVDCKNRVYNKVREFISPIREARIALENKPDYVWEILNKGSSVANSEAHGMLSKIRRVIKISE